MKLKRRCPKCKSDTLHVRKTMPLKSGEVIRYYSCGNADCDYRYYTEEKFLRGIRRHKKRAA